MAPSGFVFGLMLMLTKVAFLETIFGVQPSIFALGRVSQCHTRLIEDKFSLPDRFVGTEESAWAKRIDQVAHQYKPLDLGLGFADFQIPNYVRNALASAATSRDPLLNQYTEVSGHPRLLKALAKLYSKILNRDLNWDSEILVTIGATEALFATIHGFTKPGDEWIIIAPSYDCYEPMVRGAGGKPRFITLKPNDTVGVISSGDWVLDRAELEGLFNEKTKGIIVNTPHNPTGKVFTLEELQVIADLAKKWNTLVISDEVYEWLVYKPLKHIRMATLPDMYERTITIGSAGKTFSATGWKIGWAYGPAYLIFNLRVVHTYTVDTCSTTIQEALAVSFEVETARLGQPDSYFGSLPRELLPKRNFMVSVLKEVGMTPIVPQGGYLVVADWSALAKKVNLTEDPDEYRGYKFTEWMIKNLGLRVIPASAYYTAEHRKLGEDYVRFCFMKKNETLRKAARLLREFEYKY